MRILVVEDERKLAHVLASAPAAEQYEVAIASGGDEGLVRATSEAFDAVVLDLMLPGQSGLQILQAMLHCTSMARRFWTFTVDGLRLRCDPERPRAVARPAVGEVTLDGVNDRPIGMLVGAIWQLDEYLPWMRDGE